MVVFLRNCIFFHTKEMITFFFPPVGREPFVKYFPANTASFVKMSLRWKAEGPKDPLLPPPCLSWGWEEMWGRGQLILRLPWGKGWFGANHVDQLCQGAPCW